MREFTQVRIYAKVGNSTRRGIAFCGFRLSDHESHQVLLEIEDFPTVFCYYQLHHKDQFPVRAGKMPLLVSTTNLAWKPHRSAAETVPSLEIRSTCP